MPTHLPTAPQRSSADRPDFVGSGGGDFLPPPPPRHTRLQFPTLPNLALDESNTSLLSALLPTLDRYNCLTAPVWKGGRSPWVRAFCDLYHEAGPWGSSKFKNVPGVTSKMKYRFKSYRVKNIYEYLNSRYKGKSSMHVELRRRLGEYYAKENYYKKFMDACQDIALDELKKSKLDRAAIPMKVTELGTAASSTGGAISGQERARVSENTNVEVEVEVSEISTSEISTQNQAVDPSKASELSIASTSDGTTSGQKRPRENKNTNGDRQGADREYIKEKAVHGVDVTVDTEKFTADLPSGELPLEEPNAKKDRITIPSVEFAMDVEEDVDVGGVDDATAETSSDGENAAKSRKYEHAPKRLKIDTEDGHRYNIMEKVQNHVHGKTETGEYETPKKQKTKTEENDNNGDNEEKLQQSIRKKRNSLVSLLKERQELHKDSNVNDAIATRIRSKIDKFDEKTMELILGDDDDDSDDEMSI